MIEVDRLRKSYGDLTAVDGVSFTARPGEIFGLLGPNGAGKTTTLGCISGLLTPSAGLARVMGYDVVRQGTQARRSLGVVPQDIALYEDLSAIENLTYWGGAQGLCDRLAIVDHGRIIAQGTLTELRALLGERDLLRFAGSFRPEATRQAVQHLAGIDVVQAEDNLLVLALADASSRLPEVFAA